jgi:hypothetical protein
MKRRRRSKSASPCYADGRAENGVILANGVRLLSISR